MSKRPEVEVPGVKSRPCYGSVQLQPRARLHLFIYQPDAQAQLQPLIESVDPSSCQQFEVAGTALAPALVDALQSAPLASAIYLAGDESFLWDMRNLVRGNGFTERQIAMLQPLNSARRVFCTHCYTLTEGVTHSPMVCSGCQRPLLVRDHFSRLHGAYVGVQINAENPEDLPQEEPLS